VKHQLWEILTGNKKLNNKIIKNLLTCHIFS
jgi:hypothetical protein